MSESSKGPRSKTAQTLARTLLAGTCLTGAANVAAASIITEGVGPAPADFANSANGYILPSGTTQVIGSVNSGVGDSDDWFQFQNLLPASAFTFTGVSNCCSNYYNWEAYNSVGGLLGTGFSDGEAAFELTSTVPGDGILVVHAQYNEGTGGYTLDATVTEASVPEPATMALTGMALGGALAWHRRRKQ